MIIFNARRKSTSVMEKWATALAAEIGSDIRIGQIDSANLCSGTSVVKRVRNELDGPEARREAVVELQPIALAFFRVAFVVAFVDAYRVVVERAVMHEVHSKRKFFKLAENGPFQGCCGRTEIAHA